MRGSERICAKDRVKRFAQWREKEAVSPYKPFPSGGGRKNVVRREGVAGRCTMKKPTIKKEYDR